MKKNPFYAFLEGAITAIVAHAGAHLAVVSFDRLLEIIGHVAVIVAINIGGKH